MSDKNWKATTASEEIAGESYSAVVEELKKTDTGEIWTIHYHDKTNHWTTLDKITVEEGQLQAAPGKHVVY